MNRSTSRNKCPKATAYLKRRGMQTPMEVLCAKQTEVVCREATHGALQSVTDRRGMPVKGVNCWFVDHHILREKPKHHGISLEERVGSGQTGGDLA